MLEVVLSDAEKERIFSKIIIDPKTQCWNWTGAKDRGYGVIKFRGINQKIHRLLYAAFIEPLIEYDGVNVLDHVVCNNPSCCNPKHVKLVKQSYNILRGSSNSAINSRKKYCIRGHPLPEAREKYGKGKLGRRCIVCRNINKRRRYYKKKNA